VSALCSSKDMRGRKNAMKRSGGKRPSMTRWHGNSVQKDKNDA